MKRWLVGSLALNVLLLGIGAGFLAMSVLPLPPRFPPFGPRPGIQRDLIRAAEESLREPQRRRVLDILERAFAEPEGARPPFPPRPDDLLRDFVEGRLPQALAEDTGFDDRRRRDAEAVRRAFVEMGEVLDRPSRQALAEALHRRMDNVRACLDGPAAN